MSEPLSVPAPDWADKTFAGIVSVFTGGPRKIMGSYTAWRRKSDQDSLEAYLAKVIETANGHQAKGVPHGAPVYFALRDQANVKINAFCAKWTVDRTLIEAEAPNLAELEKLCIPRKGASPATKLLACFLGGIFSLVLIGMASGLVSFGHNEVVHVLAKWCGQ